MATAIVSGRRLRHHRRTGGHAAADVHGADRDRDRSVAADLRRPAFGHQLSAPPLNLAARAFDFDRPASAFDPEDEDLAHPYVDRVDQDDPAVIEAVVHSAWAGSWKRIAESRQIAESWTLMAAGWKPTPES